MSVALTQLASDNFRRANVSPLAAPWAIDAHGDPGLAIISDTCVASNETLIAIQIYDLSGGTPNDQFASATFASYGGNDGASYLGIRLTDGGGVFSSGWAGYVLSVNGGTSSWTLYNWQSKAVLASGSVTANVGDVFTLAAVGTTIYVFQNSKQLASVSDSSFAAGSTILGLPAFAGEVEFSNFAMGSAAIVSTSGDGRKVTITGHCDYALGSTPTLATQVANRLIAAGLATELGTGTADGQQVTITGKCDYPIGSTPTLAYQAAQRLIAAGVAQAV